MPRPNSSESTRQISSWQRVTIMTAFALSRPSTIKSTALLPTKYVTMEYSGKIQLPQITPIVIYSTTLYAMTKEPTVSPSRFAKMTAMTSMPSMAPPQRMVRPLPMPEIKPPKMAHSSKSDPAKGEAVATSTGSTSLIRKETPE